MLIRQNKNHQNTDTKKIDQNTNTANVDVWQIKNSPNLFANMRETHSNGYKIRRAMSLKVCRGNGMQYIF